MLKESRVVGRRCCLYLLSKDTAILQSTSYKGNHYLSVSLYYGHKSTAWH